MRSAICDFVKGMMKIEDCLKWKKSFRILSSKIRRYVVVMYKYVLRI